MSDIGIRPPHPGGGKGNPFGGGGNPFGGGDGGDSCSDPDNGDDGCGGFCYGGQAGDLPSPGPDVSYCGGGSAIFNGVIILPNCQSNPGS